ncbi:MAG: glycosyl hydrolase 53 family protein [Prevotella sp.]|nr:glycosyl hydrolase 53 family protein [Prevotella sp.]
MRRIIVITVCALIAFGAKAQEKYLGGDISMLPVYEQNKVAYKDKTGTTQSDVLQFFGNNGWNAERVRLFVDPYSGVEHDATGVYQTLDYVKALGKRIKDHGQKFMLDFHYSDTWTDPGKHSLPKSWEGLTVEQLKTKIYEYTKECLTELKEAGATPDFIQPGNEITTGMLWPTGGINGHGDNSWANFAGYLGQAIKACKEVCPEAKIVIHTELHNAGLAVNFYAMLKTSYPSIQYDVMGLSYYPRFHGTVADLEQNVIKKLEALNSDKEIMIVETGHGYKWAIGTGTTEYDLSEAGQQKFTSELITMLNKHESVTGLFWWYPEDNGKNVKYNNEYISWWNGALFDHDTGKPYAAFYELMNFRPDFVTGIESVTKESGNTSVYSLDGQLMGNDLQALQKGIYIKNNKKVVR